MLVLFIGSLSVSSTHLTCVGAVRKFVFTWSLALVITPCSISVKGLSHMRAVQVRIYVA